MYLMLYDPVDRWRLGEYLSLLIYIFNMVNGLNANSAICEGSLDQIFVKEWALVKCFLI